MVGLVRENIKIALGSIKTQLLRTILTVMIIAIGITALVGILGAVSMIEHKLTTSFVAMGANTFTLNQYSNQTRTQGDGEVEKINPIISYAEAKAFRENYKYPFTHTSISFTATANAEVKYENDKTDPEVSVLGVDDNYIPNSGLEVVTGRNFTNFDIENNSYVCVLGADFEKKLLKDINPIDKTISIRGAKFKVIGILKEKGSTFGNSQDLRVLAPLQVARTLFTAPNINYTTSVMIDKKEFLDEAVDDAMITMRKVRKLNPIEDTNFGISRSDDLINKIKGLSDYLNWAAIIISLITIFGSSIALMNIMLVSVTERTREIGTRKALGAKRSTIAFQFFMETLVIGQIGGILGIVLGLGLSSIFSSFLDFEFVIPWLAIFSAFIVSFIVAVVSGSYPAMKAAKLDPIEALRYE
ncbi:MAG: ABC transporter permease [Bacteroidota bacterium]